MWINSTMTKEFWASSRHISYFSTTLNTSKSRGQQNQRALLKKHNNTSTLTQQQLKKKKEEEINTSY